MDVLSPFISVLCHSMGSPVYVLMLFIQAAFLWSSSPAWTRHCSLHYLFLVSLWCDHSMLASLLWQCLTVSCLLHLVKNPLICFLSVHKTRRIFLSPFIAKVSRLVSSFFLSVQLSELNVATGHTSAPISHIFVEIGKLWLFHTFCSHAPIACPLFNLVWNSIVHSPSSVIRDPRYGNVSTCSSCSFWMSMRHAMSSLAITSVFSTLMSRLYLRLTPSRRSTSSCSSVSEVAYRMMSSA